MRRNTPTNVGATYISIQRRVGILSRATAVLGVVLVVIFWRWSSVNKSTVSQESTQPTRGTVSLALSPSERDTHVHNQIVDGTEQFQTLDEKVANESEIDALFDDSAAPADELSTVQEIIRKNTGSDKSRFLAAFRYHQKEVYMRYMEDRFLAGLADEQSTLETERALNEHLSNNAYLGDFEHAEVTCSADVCFIDVFDGNDFSKVADVFRRFLPGWPENETFIQVVPVERVSEGIHRMYIVREDIDLSDLSNE